LVQEATWDVGITLEKLVNHSPSPCDVESVLVFFQHPAWFIEPINHRNVWYIASMKGENHPGQFL